MRKTEVQGLPAGISGTAAFVIDCSEDFQTVIHVTNLDVLARGVTFEGFPGPVVTNPFNVPALTTIPIVLSANAYSPATAGGVAPGTVHYPAYASVRITANWLFFNISVHHIAPGEGFNVRKIEVQGLPAGVSGTMQHIFDCSEDYQTIVHIQNLTGAGLVIDLEGGAGPRMVTQPTIPAGATIPFVFGAGAYSPASGGGVAPGAAQYPAYSTIALTPVGGTWASYALSVVHVIA